MHSLQELFSSEGAFSEHFGGFTPRDEQLAMANAVQAAIDNKETVLIEAGTGVGKTFSYLVPALLSGKKVIVSTGTKALQEQLYERDLATVCTVLNISIKTALLKGRGNYLCPYRLQKSLTSFKSQPRKFTQLLVISQWGGETLTGDLSSTALLDDHSSLWSSVTSSADNCLGQECPDWEQCFLVKARRKAQKADVVVVNHHLLFADFVLREEGFGEVLPDADIFIVDEAHQLPDIGSQFLGKVLGTRQLAELSSDVCNEMDSLANDMPDLAAAAEQLVQAAAQMEQSSGGQQHSGSWDELMKMHGFMPALRALEEAMHLLSEYLAIASERSKGLDRCYQRAEDLLGRLHIFMPPSDGQPGMDPDGKSSPDDACDNEVKWFERRTRALVLRATPLDIGASFQGFLSRSQATWVMTSATMTIADSFDYFSQRLGLEACTKHLLGSPFDYRRQSILYLPSGLPEPRERSYTQKMMEKALEVIELSQGRAFILFTSFKALHEAEDFLQHRIEYPLLVQGRDGKTELLRKFRKLGNAVLLGTMSFWEGVDVKGPALSCVIIDKLPFAPPGDPVLSARLASMKRQGRNPFMEHQLPNAAILLKQGLGRLIRDANDRGVLMICDPRIRTARYGKTFLKSLPEMAMTQNIKDIEGFL